MRSSPPPRATVFVLDGFWRKSLSAVRALGRTGRYRIVVGEQVRFSTALFSRHAWKTVVYPSPATRPGPFLRAVARVVERYGVDVLLPMEEATLMLLARFRERIPPRAALPFADAATLDRSRDKARAYEAAAALSLPAPRTFVPGGKEPPPDDFPLPALVKPRVGSGARGIVRADTRAALEKALCSVPRRYGPVLVQECLPREGAGLGVSFILDGDGAPLARFVHRRLREYPVEGGASTLRESVHDTALEDGALRLLRHLGFVGPAMVEFKTDARDGSAKLLEVNPRFWGSLELAVAAGVNFPDILASWALGRATGPSPGYRAGVRCRWLLPGDALHFLRNPDRWRLVPPFFRFREPDLYFDILRRDDMLPVFGRLLSLLPAVGSAGLRPFLAR